MSSYKVRLYKESDHRTVHEIFTSGCHEHISPAFYNALKQPHISLILLVGLVLPLVSNGSILFSILVGVILLLMLWLPGREFFLYHLRHGVAGDLKNISKHYLEREGYCFWVVELQGEAVGMVAAIPYITPHERSVELKRMFVSRAHRGKGLAKLLCSTVIDFARKSGHHAVILTTTAIQVDARRLYEKMGFKSADLAPYNPVLNLVGMPWVGYRYDIPSSR
ncbi:probable N-acetyltransferase CML1 [Bufo bufo]|uniref:probable N-acetyltransferase CML1 n=1 Tax=Bufo bufo TaxID=8384 RepID=UPI001ABD9EF1|nr:probable N-acetyltransferase CML1 [Bufo bufo]